MQIYRAGAIIILALALPAAGQVATAGAAPARASCPAPGYMPAHAACKVLPASGTFKLTIPGTSFALKGSGSSKVAGNEVTVTKISAPVPSKGGFGFRLTASGGFGSLHPSSGKVWKYNASSNKLKSVKTIKSTGIYQVTK